MTSPGTRPASQRLVTEETVDDHITRVGNATYAPVSRVVDLVVRKTPGPGEFASPKLACDTITDSGPLKQYRVTVFPGTYTETEWTVPPYTTLEGTDKDRCWLKGELPATATDAQMAGTSTFWVKKTATVKNFRITAKNMRYAIHDEQAGDNRDERHTFENCHIEHFGNQAVIDYRAANALPAGSPWASTFAYGYGAASGLEAIFIDCTFAAPGQAWGVHNNTAFTRPNVNRLTRSRILNTSTPNNGSNSDYRIAAFPLISCGSGVKDKVYLEGCELPPTFILDHDAPWLATTDAGQYANHSDYEVIATGTMIGWKSNAQGRALKIATTTGYSTNVVEIVGGSAVPIILGDYVTKPGGGGINAYAYGSLDISGLLVGPNGDQTVKNTLGRRLGNCTTATKDLVVKFNTTTRTHTFDKDYTAMTNAAVLSELNTTFASVGSATEWDVTQREVYPQFLDRQRTLRNDGTVGVLRWSAVKIVAGSVAQMETSDPLTAFAGFAIEDIAPKQSGRILTEGLLAGTQMRGFPTLADGTAVYLSDASAGSVATTGTKLIGTANHAGFVFFRGANR